MDVLIAAGIVFFIVTSILSIVLIRANPRLFFAITILTTIICLGFFVWIFLDVINMQKYFQNSSKIVFLEQNGTFLTGLVFSENPDYFNASMLDYYSNAYQKKDYKAILGEHYKLMVFSIHVLDELPNATYMVEGFRLSKDDALKALQSENPTEYLGNAPIAIPDDNDFVKASLFSIVLTDGVMDTNDPLYFFTQYKKGNVFVYPRTAIFTSLKIIPLVMVKTILDKVSQKISTAST